MFTKFDEGGYRELIPGVRLKTLAHGERTLLGSFRFVRGAVVPTHQHPHEQTGFVVSGRLRFVVDGEPFEAAVGDSWCIPGNTDHSAEAVEESVVVEVFSPIREDYLP